jgi:hypothetical protein
MKKEEKRKEISYPLLNDYVFKQIYGSRKGARRLALLLKPLLPLRSWVRSKLKTLLSNDHGTATSSSSSTLGRASKAAPCLVRNFRSKKTAFSPAAWSTT